MTTETTGAAPQPAATIRDSITAAIDELEPSTSTGDEAGSEAAGGGESTEKPSTAAERQRDEQGRFTKREEAQAATETSAKPPKEPKPAASEQQTGEQQATGDKTATATSDPPAHWSAEDKAWIASLPKEHQASVIDRFKKIEAGFTPKLQRAASLEKDYGEVDKHFEPYQQAMTQQGWTKGSLIKAWADVELALANDPYAQMRKIAQHYKVDLNKLAGVDGATAAATTAAPATATLVPTGGEDILNHPHIKALQTQLQELTGRLQGLTNAEQQRAQQAQQAATQKTMTEIQAFAEAKGEDGSLSHPHFADVLNDMLTMAQAERAAGRTPVLQDLYDRTVWANPQTRATQIAAETTKAAAKAKADTEEAQRKQAAEAKARADKARKAGSSVTGAPSGVGQAGIPKSKGSLRDDILAAADEVDG